MTRKHSPILIDISVLRSMFTMPIEDAAKCIGVSVTVLKRNCRAQGVARWPYRKINSIDNMIKELKDRNSNSFKVSQRIETLQKLRHSVVYGDSKETENKGNESKKGKDWTWNPSPSEEIVSSNTTFELPSEDLQLPVIKNNNQQILPSFSELVSSLC